MPLIKCKECGGPMNLTAFRCTGCGYLNHVVRRLAWAVVIVLFLALMALYVIYKLKNPRAPVTE
ncbi:MAG TPA: hypothetical protein VMV72_06845 [Verrucomicrobiae bacterium]|nr:hypothetical protein [Verrucomicrobiae bacterium]